MARAGTHPACPDGDPSLGGEFLYETEDGEDLWNQDTDAYSGYFGDRAPRCGDLSARVHDSVMGVVTSELDGAGLLALVGESGALALRYDPEAPPGRELTLTSSSRSR